MKKLLSALLAGAMLLSLNVTAFAAAASSTTTLAEITKWSGQPVDKDGVNLSVSGSITPNQTIYFLIPDEAAKFLNDTKNARLTTRKVKNPKLVKSVKLVEKRLTANAGKIRIPTSTAAIDANSAATFTDVPVNTRHTYLAVELNDTTSDEEFKVQLDFTFTAKKAAELYYGNTKPALIDGTNTLASLSNGKKLTLKSTFYVQNTQEEGDASVTVGTSGMTVKPIKNSDNEVVFEADDTLATLTFRTSSSPDKFYAKLSTKWTSALLSKFKNTDAVLRRFSPANIDATSRATLALNNPFDTDDVDPEDVRVYTADSKNKLKDITKTVVYNEDDDTFEIKTRALTTYILSDVKVGAK